MSGVEHRARSAIAQLKSALAMRGVRGLTNLRTHFWEMDIDKSGALSQKEIAEHFGNDHKLSKEIIEKLRAQRASQGEGASLESKGMTLTEFKSLLIDGTSTRSTRKRTKTRKKDRNPPRPDQTVQSV